MNLTKPALNQRTNKQEKRALKHSNNQGQIMTEKTSSKTSTFSRRKFQGTSAGVAAALAVSGVRAQDSSRYSPSAPPVRYPE
ncbi:MAG: hypothetical protein RL120_13525, partial [Gammaproteobacteria bacterium]